MTQHIETAMKTGEKMIVGGSGLSGGSWLWGTLGNNSEAIVAACALIGAVCAVAGLVITVITHLKSDK